MDKISVIFYLIPSKKKSLFGYTGLTENATCVSVYLTLLFDIGIFDHLQEDEAKR